MAPAARRLLLGSRRRQRKGGEKGVCAGPSVCVGVYRQNNDVNQQIGGSQAHNTHRGGNSNNSELIGERGWQDRRSKCFERISQHFLFLLFVCCQIWLTPHSPLKVTSCSTFFVDAPCRWNGCRRVTPFDSLRPSLLCMLRLKLVCRLIGP